MTDFRKTVTIGKIGTSSKNRRNGNSPQDAWRLRAVFVEIGSNVGWSRQRYRKCHYNANGNRLACSEDGLHCKRELVPTLKELASILHQSDSVYLYTDMGDGGGISCAAGFLSWMETAGLSLEVTVVLAGFFPVGNLPISATPPQRIAWLKRRFPFARFNVAEAKNAKLLSEYQHFTELEKRADDSPALNHSRGNGKVGSNGSVPGLTVLGTGSSVGKGTTAFILGSVLQAHGLRPVPFKATGCIETLHDNFPVQRCSSTLMQWCHWAGPDENLPSFLNPVLFTPSSESAADGQCSMFNPADANQRLCRPYRLAEYFSEANWTRLDEAFHMACDRAADYVAENSGVLIAEGAGSPLEMSCRWDFANEYPRDLLGLASLLVTSNDNRGFFTLQGTLEEHRHRTIPLPEAVIVCDTIVDVTHLNGHCVKTDVVTVCSKYSVKYLGSIPFIPAISKEYNEDKLPPLVSKKIAENPLQVDVDRIGTLDIDSLKNMVLKQGKG